MPQTNSELAESILQFVTIWKMIGRPFPRVDQMDRPGLAITWPATHFPFYNALFLTDQLTDAQVLQDRVQAERVDCKDKVPRFQAGRIKVAL
jgi:hypothetical protein